MKPVLLAICCLLLFTARAHAQTPQAFKYQTIVRDAAGQILANQPVSLKFELQQSTGSDIQTIYGETHTASTTDFGLVNLEIGRGTVVLGDFSQIDWSKQTHIAIGLDAAGGANYQHMGKAELLSVPYALYAAKAAGSSEFPVAPKTGDILFYDGLAWQRLAGGVPGAVLTMGADSKPFWKSPPMLDSLLVLTLPDGETLYVHPTDIAGVEWGGYGTDITALPNVTEKSVANLDFNGETNTALIIAQLGANGGTPYAAQLCDNLVDYGFDDWYLPAEGELQEIYKKLGVPGSSQIPKGYYWSSTENSAHYAWVQDFIYGFQFSGDSKWYKGTCRCARR